MESEKDVSRNYLLIYSIAITFYVIAFIYWFVPDLDKNIVVAHNGVYHNEFLLRFFTFASDYGLSLMLIIYSGLLFYQLKESDSIEKDSLFFIMVILSVFIAGAAGDISKLFIGRERPVVDLAGLIERTIPFKTLSFPSGHTTKAVALALPFIFIDIKNIRYLNFFRIIILIIAVLVAYSRIAIQAHYPSDVMGGIGTAFFFLPLAFIVGDKVQRYCMEDDDGEKKVLISILIIFMILAVLDLFA